MIDELKIDIADKYVVFLDILGFESYLTKDLSRSLVDHYLFFYQKISESLDLTRCVEKWIIGDSSYLLFNSFKDGMIFSKNMMESCIQSIKMVSNDSDFEPFLLRGALTYGKVISVNDKNGINYLATAAKRAYELVEGKKMKGAKFVIDRSLLDRIDSLGFLTNVDFDVGYKRSEYFEFLWPRNYLEKLTKEECVKIIQTILSLIDGVEKKVKVQYTSTLKILLKAIKKTKYSDLYSKYVS